MQSKTRAIFLPGLAVLLLAGWGLTGACHNGGTRQARADAQQAAATATSSETGLAPPAVDVFQPQVAGAFYPADPSALREMISRFIEQAAGAGKKISGDLLGVLAPHAGYRYSGPVAAHAFRLLRGRGYRRVVVLGPAHRRGYRTPALLDARVYRTPLGDIPIDREAVQRLAKTGAARIDNDKFTGEHGLEVELPFLQVVLKDFRLVPLMISYPEPERMKQLAGTLAEMFPGRDTVFVASSDMSHDFPYAVAVAMDENALRYVTALDGEGLYRAYRAFHRAGPRARVKDGRIEPDCAQFCGLGAVLTLMELARKLGPARVTVLDRRNSGDIVGDRSSRIVGYGAVAFALERPRPDKKAGAAPAAAPGDYLTAAEKKELLEIARTTLEDYLKNGHRPDFSPRSPALLRPGAAFVTLKKHGRLRGCIGYMEPAQPLWQMVRDRAIDAAVHDSRFPPVTAGELGDIEIEISVLTPRVEVADPLKEIVIGRDGVWLELGYNRGVFLPQVPVEQGWKTVEVYLDNLCRKAHVFEKGCWKSGQAHIMRFTALVFGEGK